MPLAAQLLFAMGDPPCASGKPVGIICQAVLRCDNLSVDLTDHCQKFPEIELPFILEKEHFVKGRREDEELVRPVREAMRRNASGSPARIPAPKCVEVFVPI